MKEILVIGAGRSTQFLIEYLEKYASQEDWHITVADKDPELAKSRISGERSRAIPLDINEKTMLSAWISKADLVVSMLPAHLHIYVAKLCLQHKVNLCTASYLTDELKALDQEVKNAGLTFLNEIGLDPGIDHMSAMKLIHQIQSDGGYIREFESFTGGLLAPQSENPPWRYKFTWNPRNVVLAGQGGAVKFIQNGLYKFIPYHKLFRRTEIIEIDDYGKFEGYANRDSLKYRSVYGLNDVQTMYRGTLRRPGFCRGWDLFVQLGLTDDSYILPDSENMTIRQFINTFLAYNVHDSVEIKLRQYLKIDQDDVDLWEKLESLDLFTDEVIGIPNATPAMVLEHILKRKWTLEESDADMIVMWHKLIYEREDAIVEVHSSMVSKGMNKAHTAMARTVGLPLAIACRLILNGTIKQTGTILPISAEIYLPILQELEEYGISFQEKVMA